MKIVRPQVLKMYFPMSGPEALERLEVIGRTAYKSEASITPGSAKKFVEMILTRGHESVIEHLSVSARVLTDRGILQEIVRHRIASYTVESTRYCDYSKEKFKSEVTFVLPWFLQEESGDAHADAQRILDSEWYTAMRTAEGHYLNMLSEGATPQAARSVLPNSTKTEIVVTYNLREWRHFLRLRTGKGAHPDMQFLANMLQKELKDWLPELFAQNLASPAFGGSQK